MSQFQTVCRFAALLGAVTAIACAGPTGPTVQELESHAIETQQQYLIGPADVLQVSVWQQPTLSLDTVVVRLDGKISFPLLDDVHAAGMTTTELKVSLTERLKEFITAPHVTVIVRQINSKEVYLIGEVTRVGPVRLKGGMRVVDALSTAGGFRTFAAKSRVKIIRDMNGSGTVEFMFDYPEFANGDNLEQNILLLPGDRIVVPEQSAFGR
jgi:polysaccharide export outer membrane protein